LDLAGGPDVKVGALALEDVLRQSQLVEWKSCLLLHQRRVVVMLLATGISGSATGEHMGYFRCVRFRERYILVKGRAL
jgi:hypothetical protein